MISNKHILPATPDFPTDYFHFNVVVFCCFFPTLQVLGGPAKVQAAVSHPSAKQNNRMIWKMYNDIVWWEVTRVAVNDSWKSAVSLCDFKSPMDLNREPIKGQYV